MSTRNFFQLASRKTNTLTFEEGGELTVRADISKGAFRALLARMPEDVDEENARFTPLQADDFTTGLFEALVVDWSAIDPDTGNPVPATVENYLALPREVASVIDARLLDYFNSLSVKEEDKSEGETVSV